MNIPKIIMQQLFGLDRMKVWSWGAHDFSTISKTALAFKVDGHHLKGIVVIELNLANDLYNISFYKNVSIQSYLKQPIEAFAPINGVYCDQMVDLIDEKVEKIDAYKW